MFVAGEGWRRSGEPLKRLRAKVAEDRRRRPVLQLPSGSGTELFLPESALPVPGSAGFLNRRPVGSSSGSPRPPEPSAGHHNLQSPCMSTVFMSIFHASVLHVRSFSPGLFNNETHTRTHTGLCPGIVARTFSVPPPAESALAPRV